MLDRLFLSKLSPKGKVMYWVGQLSAIALVCLLLFGVQHMGFREGEPALIGSIIAIIVVWGLICMAVWPKLPDAPPPGGPPRT